MRDIFISVTGGTAAATAYIPVPAKGNVVSVKAVFSKTVAADDTVTVSRGATAVNTLTTGATTLGVVYTGTPDSTNKDLIFDPDSSTAANKYLKIAISALESTLTEVGIWIRYDDMAIVAQ